MSFYRNDRISMRPHQLELEDRDPTDRKSLSAQMQKQVESLCPEPMFVHNTEEYFKFIGMPPLKVRQNHRRHVNGSLQKLTI